MGISFHCQSCKKKIKAPDEAGGKWGRCPGCNHRNYIPLPPAPEEEQLKLKPLDQSDETQYGSLMEETYSLTKDILNETAVPEDDEDVAAESISERDVLRKIIEYMIHMSQGRLERAAPIAEGLREHSEKAKDILNRMMRSQRPEAELAEIPPKLLQGFCKQLQGQL